MSASNFIACFNATAGEEGGYADNPHDPGGSTMDGVTQAVYTRYLTTHGRANAPVKEISLIDRQAIYRADFWNEVHGDDLYAGLDLCMVDAAWGSGPVEAVKWLQRALGILADGKFGEQTLTALKRYENSAVLITRVCEERMAMSRALPTWKYFGKGWTARYNNIESKALAMRKVVLANATASPYLPRKVTDPIAAVPAYIEGSTMTSTTTTALTPSTTNLLDTLESLLVAAVDAAPEVSADFKAAVAEFQTLKASPFGVDLSNVIGQLFSHSTASNTVHLPATNVAIVTPNIAS